MGYTVTQFITISYGFSILWLITAFFPVIASGFLRHNACFCHHNFERALKIKGIEKRTDEQGAKVRAKRIRHRLRLLLQAFSQIRVECRSVRFKVGIKDLHKAKSRWRLQ